MTLHVVHLIYKLDIGGLERFMVDMINRFQAPNYQHTGICLTCATDFAQELRSEVKVITLNKAPGKDLGLHIRLYQTLKQLRPDVFQTYNLAALEYYPIAFFAGAKKRLHAEHGRDSSDPEGKNWKHRLLRKLINPLSLIHL